MAEQFEVKQTVILAPHEQLAINDKEVLFFYHGWTRDEIDLIQTAHDILIELPNCGLIANYEETHEYKTIESLLRQYEKLDDYHGKVRLNCAYTGKFKWVSNEYLPEIYNDLMDRLSDYIREAYGLKNYWCGFDEGNWGLWFNHEDDLI